MTRQRQADEATLEAASVYALAFTADISDLSLSLRFVYRNPEHLVAAAEWFFVSSACPFRGLFNELVLHPEFEARLWAISDGEARNALDVTEYVLVHRGDDEPIPLVEAAPMLEDATPDELGALRMTFARDAFLEDLPVLGEAPLAAGQRAVVRPAQTLEKSLQEPLNKLYDRAKHTKLQTITYGPMDLETGLRIDGFDDPDPAPEGARYAPQTLDELRDEIVLSLSDGDPLRAGECLARLERGLTYPLYELRAEIALLSGATDEALTNALLGLTPAPTEEQVELVNRAFEAWIDSGEADVDLLLDHVEQALIGLDAVELFDSPETIAQALRELLAEPPRARLALLESIAAKDDLSRLDALLDREVEAEHERPAVATGAMLLGLYADAFGDEERALAMLRKAHATAPSMRTAVALGLRLREQGLGGGLEALRQCAALADSPSATSAVVDAMYERYTILHDIEHEPFDGQLEQALDALARAKAYSAALKIAEVLSERGHWLGLYQQGCMLEALGRHEDAIGAFRRALHDWLGRAKRRERLDLRAVRADATFRLACAEAALGRHEAALQTLERACRLDETNQRRAREAVVFQPLWSTTEFMRVAGGAGAEKIATIAIGADVEHPKFGVGKVVHVEGEGDSAKLTIVFAEAGQKKLLARFVKVI